MREAALAWLLIGCAAALAVLASIPTAAVYLVTSIACGAAPADGNFFTGVSVVLLGVDAPTATGCVSSRGWVIGTSMAIFVLLIVIAGFVAYQWRMLKRSDWWFIHEMRTRDGFADIAELAKELSSKALRKSGAHLRPRLAETRKPQARDVAWKAGTSRSIDMFVSVEESVVLLGPPRSGKGFRILIDAILDWPGPLVTTSTTTDNLTATRSHRAGLGTVHVFDPQKLSGEQHPARISPITGCDDPLTATQRAAVLVAGAGMSGGQNQEWAEQAKAQLAALLCAAALDDRTVLDLARWGSSPALAVEAVDILTSHPVAPAGWGAALASVIDGDPRLLGNIWFGVTGAVAPLRIPEIAEAMTPTQGEKAFDPVEFLNGQNTLYLIGTKTGAGAAGGYLAALLDDIVETARRHALASEGSRLDPPLGLILDEIANMFVWPSLPSLMSDGGGRGICPIVVLQSRKQAEVVWSAGEMHAVFGAATVTIQLGGSTDNEYLSEIQSLLGTREMRRTSTSYSEQGTSSQVQTQDAPLMTSAELRRMPRRLGLLLTKNIRPVLLDLAKWTDRADAKKIIAGKKETTSGQLSVFIEQERVRTERRTLVNTGPDATPEVDDGDAQP